MNATTRALRAAGRWVLGMLLLLAACTGQTQQRQGDAGERGPTELAASKLRAPLSGAYKIKTNGSRVPPREKELPVPLGSVEAHWYRGDGVYVIAFSGLDLKETGPLCPGSSIQTGAGFEHVTNSPTKGKACEGATNLAGPGAGVKICGPLVFYVSEIPEDTKGDLFASIERYERKGEIVGVTGVVDADMSAAPTIDPGADEYTLAKGFVTGTTEVTC